MFLFPWQKKKKRKRRRPRSVLTPTPLGYRTASLQGIGKRERQEDSFELENHQDVKKQRKMGLLAVVADGMGGMLDGRLASNTVTTCLCNSFVRQAPLEAPDEWLEKEVYEVNEQVQLLLGGQGGSTLVCTLIHEDLLWFVSVGDSFLYLYRNRELSRLNRMQTVLHREYMGQIQSGSVDPWEARRHPEAVALTGFLGMVGLEDIDVLRSPLPLKNGDILLLCSDGVGGVLEEEDIMYCLNQGHPDEICEALRQRVLSKEKRYQDNFTAVVIQCVK